MALVVLRRDRIDEGCYIHLAVLPAAQLGRDLSKKDTLNKKN